MSAPAPIRVDALNHFFGSGALQRQVLFDISAEIPAGEHVVTIQVADSEKRLAERQLSITVREESVLERRAKE